jgi:hypothetical protein
MVSGDKFKPDKLTELFKEFHYRTYAREFEFLLDKAQEISKLGKALAEVKTLIKE